MNRLNLGLAVSLAMSGAVIAYAAPASPVGAPTAATQQQVNQAAQAAITELGALVTQAQDNRATIAAMQTLLRSADMAAPEADKLKTVLQQWVNAANSMAQAQVVDLTKQRDAADARSAELTKQMTAAKQVAEIASQQHATDQKTITELRAKVSADEKQIAALKQQSMVRPLPSPENALPHSVPPASARRDGKASGLASPMKPRRDKTGPHQAAGAADD